ncbi:MAG TPA: DUF2231 domain-containing protein [Burkholderiaceae bacterium]|nr:DUF2231 domain-containing protein [Burkholderiaceae bacterium]
MRTPANIAGHPIHPMLVTIPIGLWVFSLVLDLISLGSQTPQLWAEMAYFTMLGGILGALAAAVPGLLDFLSLPKGAIKKTAVLHMGLNLTIVALYTANAWLRYIGMPGDSVPIGLSIAAIVMLLASGWLGGKMVFLSGVGVSAAGAQERPPGVERRATHK